MLPPHSELEKCCDDFLLGLANPPVPPVKCPTCGRCIMYKLTKTTLASEETPHLTIEIGRNLYEVWYCDTSPPDNSK